MNALSNQHGAATNRTLSNILAMLGIVMASFALLTNAAQAGVAPDTLIAYWNFNVEDPPGTICGWGCPDEEPFQSDSGSGQIDVTGWGGAVAIGGTHGAGTEINALFGDPAGSAFVLWGPGDGTASFTHIDFMFSMTNHQDLSMSFALRPQWSSVSGQQTFDTHVWSWSTDGVNFTDALGYEITEFGGISFWETYDLDFSSVTELNGAENVTLRLTLSGANSSQRTSFDNIQIHAEPVGGGSNGDLNGDGDVNVTDLLLLLGDWGDCTDCTPGECPADLDGNCVVNVSDLLLLLANWGPVCVPDCTGNECGDDGCGGSCGTCPDGQNCEAGQCTDPPDPNSCAGNCGGPAPGGCFCDEDCFGFGDCCDDVCDQCNFPNQCPEEGGCAGFCGGMNPDKGCFCDQDCFEFGDCCENICDQCDFPEQCPEEGGCVGFCGEMNPDEECFCDPDCCEFGDCCPNQFEVCGGCEP